MKMKAAHTGSSGERVEPRHLDGGIHEPAGIRDRRGLPFGPRRLIGAASLAGAETGPLGIRTSGMESHVFAQCLPGRARRTAVDSGSPHRIIESRVGGTVAPYHCRPLV